MNVTGRMRQASYTAAQWTGQNPVLLAGEYGYESDTGKMKVGNGASAWNSLGYFGNDKLPVAGGTMTGQLTAQTNTNYATAQVRNAILSTTDLTPGVSPLPSGTLYFVYE